MHAPAKSDSSEKEIDASSASGQANHERTQTLEDLRGDEGHTRHNLLTLQQSARSQCLPLYQTILPEQNCGPIRNVQSAACSRSTSVRRIDVVSWDTVREPGLLNAVSRAHKFPYDPDNASLDQASQQDDQAREKRVAIQHHFNRKQVNSHQKKRPPKDAHGRRGDESARRTS